MVKLRFNEADNLYFGCVGIYRFIGFGINNNCRSGYQIDKEKINLQSDWKFKFRV